ncbi:uncharacterized protein LOC117916661 [Vitis riparia]|uniref:uncharacterized protein LOC117916661 n=1 Tax=Vitis riparia TaxID=96939 RepID=UPI00155AFBE3|nr:uncharacterized protein LOC117916661 [Vitis riparia]
MGMRKLGLLLVLLFFLQPSSNPLQNPLKNPLVSAYDEKHNVSNGGTWKNHELTKISFGQEVMVDRRGGGGHGGTENSGGGTLNNQPTDNKSKPHHNGRNGCSSNHIGLARLVFLLLTSSFLIFIFHGF